jgi:hypothetical protein
VLGLLQDIVELFENIPQYILYAIETSINGWLLLIQLALEADNKLLGGLPSIYTPPGYVSEINWYYPIVTLLGVASPFVTAYIAWLGFSWFYRKIGAM